MTPLVVSAGFRHLVPSLFDTNVVEYDVEHDHVTLRPHSRTDFWRKTYYRPVLVADNAPFLYCELDKEMDYTITTQFVLTAASQFDQAGILIRASPEHWIKTGIEVVDGTPRLSCVVTNGYSDWSTQPWGNTTESNATKNTATIGVEVWVVPECRMRVHCLHQGTSFVVEAWNSATSQWEFIRIAHLSVDMHTRPDPLVDSVPSVTSPSPATDHRATLWAGVFGACPTAQVACTATFTHFEITKGSQFHHTAD